MKKGYLSKLNIKVLTLKHPARKFENYEDEIQYLITHTQRNNFIKNLTLDQKGNTLILYTRVESHGLPLFDLINKSKEENRKCFFVHGGVDTEDREQVRTITEKKTMQLLLPHTAPSQQELTLKIFTTSYSHRQTNQKYETYKA